MPNTPALVHAGVTGLYAPPAVDEAGRRSATELLAAVGEVVWLPREEDLDAVTAVSGSGPAYVFYFLEAVEEQAGREMGIAPGAARTLALATFAGAAKLARERAEDPAVLRAQVTSKGGTTERALATMEAAGLKARIGEAVKAAAARSASWATSSEGASDARTGPGIRHRDGLQHLHPVRARALLDARAARAGAQPPRPIHDGAHGFRGESPCAGSSRASSSWTSPRSRWPGGRSSSCSPSSRS